jgi:D-amino-acid oxidase
MRGPHFYQPSRRDLLGIAATGLTATFMAAGLKGAHAQAVDLKCEPPSDVLPKDILPSPQFGNVLRFVAGLRPHRRNRYRLERDPSVDDKLLVHNYGYGGAGITMSWGCAHQVRKIVLASGLLPKEREVAIVGAGVMGLTAAMLLDELKLGLQINMYAEKFTPDTTSDVAGGQWAPSSVEHDGLDDEFADILRNAFHIHLARGSAYGVSRRPNYALHRPNNFDKAVPKDIVNYPTCLEQLPFAKLKARGYVYNTLLVEPPIFLPKLVAGLKASKTVKFCKKSFGSGDQILQLKERIIINCTGLGSGKLFGDQNMVGIKGQLALLKPQPKLRYLFSGLDCDAADGNRQWFQYMFPRSDAVVVGGTYEENAAGGAQPEVCNMLIARMKKVFDGQQDACEEAPFPT